MLQATPPTVSKMDRPSADDERAAGVNVRGLEAGRTNEPSERRMIIAPNALSPARSAGEYRLKFFGMTVLEFGVGLGKAIHEMPCRYRIRLERRRVKRGLTRAIPALERAICGP